MNAEFLVWKLIEFAEISEEINWLNHWLLDFVASLGWDVVKTTETINPRNWNRVPHYLLRKGKWGKHIAFVSHCDVVAYGDGWKSKPNSPVVAEEKWEKVIYWRWVADMLWAVACQLLVWETAVQHWKTVSIFLVCDEETDSKWMPSLIEANDLPVDVAIWWEPTAFKITWDAIKIWRRWRVHWEIKFEWDRIHTAYIVNNPGVNVPEILVSWGLSSLFDDYDEGNENMPPTSFAINAINSPDVWTNSVPETVTVWFDARISSVWTPENFIIELENRIKKLWIKYELTIKKITEPYFTSNPEFGEKIARLIYDATWIQPDINCEWWTSDCRFFWKMWIPIVEIWLCNETIHKPNECQLVSNLDKLFETYKKLIEEL